MSQENVEFVRRSFEAYASGGIEATFPFYAPDIVWDPGPEWVEETVYRGHDGIRRIDGVFLENFDDYSLQLSRRSAGWRPGGGPLRGGRANQGVDETDSTAGRNRLRRDP